MTRRNGANSPMSFQVKIERDGKTHAGSCSVENGRVTVWTTDGRRTAELGNDCTAEVLAEQLLCALVHDGKG
jgi:hypothetical protein